MAPRLLSVACFLLHHTSAREATCDVGEDATALLQTSIVPKRPSMNELFATARAAPSFLESPSDPEISLLNIDESGKPGPSAPKFGFTRPNAGKGPDTIEFGLQGKALYGADMEHADFTLDLVITAEWNDPRTTKLIPKGASNVTLSEKEALSSVWMPQLVVTNRDISKDDVISTAVMLYKSGRVIKVTRIMTIIKDKFQLKQYPFDSQDFTVKIASSQYMSSELLLRPSSKPGMSGVPSELFQGSGFDIKEGTGSGWKVYSYEDDTGLLKKSRGVLDAKVGRKFGPYLNGHLLPSMFVIALSCGVFYFPFTNPFVTPRLAMSVVAYLTFSSLAVKSNAALPAIHPTTWNDIFNQNVELVMLMVACFNLYTEVRHHITKVVSVSTSMNNELKWIMPLLNLVVVATIMIAGANHASQAAVDISLKVFLLCVVIGYAVLIELRTADARKQQEF